MQKMTKVMDKCQRSQTGFVFFSSFIYFNKIRFLFCFIEMQQFYLYTKKLAQNPSTWEKRLKNKTKIKENWRKNFMTWMVICPLTNQIDKLKSDALFIHTREIKNLVWFCFHLLVYATSCSRWLFIFGLLF